MAVRTDAPTDPMRPSGLSGSANRDGTVVRRFGRSIVYRPGGWPYIYGLPPKEGMPERVYRPRKAGWREAVAAPVFFGLILSNGIPFAVQLAALFLMPLLAMVMIRFARAAIFGDIPAVSACLFPRQEARDIWRAYLELVLFVSAVWLGTSLIFGMAVLVLKNGLGNDWNVFTRSFRMVKGGPYYEYTLFDGTMLTSGFLAITGLVWWPMYVFFERLEAKRRIRALEGATLA